MSQTVKSSRKTALVTGGARRIGACIARTLHGRGCDVVLHYHGSAEEAARLAEELDAVRAGSVLTVQADLAEGADIARLAAATRQFTPRLDLLVNNASRFFPTAVGGTSRAQWDELMESNLAGPYFLIQALLPELAAARGSVVNVLDVHAARPMKGHAVYSAAKAGLQMLTLALARELGPDVRVNGVAPGAILWPENDMTDAERHYILDRIVLGRAGEPRDVASAVAYLGLDAAYVTGQVLAVDGGRSLNI